MKPGARGVARIVDATRYSMQGIRAAWQHEAAFRQEAMITVVGIPLALWLARDIVEFLLLVVPLLLMLMAELINSAIEAVVDRVGSEHDVLSGRAKDMGSAVVFMSLLIAGLSWLCILAGRFLFNM
ncbi:MAG: diacylglycerol kinase [Pseudomonadota bacterium]